MAHYKNDYSKEEDVSLWQLHEIRHHLAEQHQSPEQINTIGLHVITEYKLNNLKIVSSGKSETNIRKKVD